MKKQEYKCAKKTKTTKLYIIVWADNKPHYEKEKMSISSKMANSGNLDVLGATFIV